VSQSLSAILARTDVPAREALEDAVEALKFKLSVDESYVPFESKGYLPCTLNGEDGGLNIRLDAVEPYLAEFPSLKDQIGLRDTLVGLRSGGDPREDVCVLMLAAALAEKFDAIVHDPKKGTIIPADKLAAWARSQFAELD